MLRRFVREAATALRCAAVVACAVAPLVVSAASMQVAPLRVALSSARPVASMTVGNADDTEIAVQAEVLAWSQEDGQDVYRSTPEVLVNPAIFRIAPGAQQIVRLGLQLGPAPVERSYRVFLQQLPRDQALPREPGAPVQVQTLLRIGVPVFVAPPAARTEAAWRLLPAPSGSGPALAIDNTGTEHIQLLQLVVRRESGAELARQPLSTYVLAGRSATLPLNLPAMAPDTPLVIEVGSDAATPLPPVRLRTPRADTAPR